KYPVAGEPNSSVSIHSYDVETRKTKQIELPSGAGYYVPRIEYGPDASKLIIASLNRDQNRYEIFVCNPKSTVSKSVYTEESSAWIEPSAYENLSLGATSFVVSRSDKDYTRYYEYSYSGAEIKCVTPGDHDATAYYGSDAAGNHYFQAAAPTPKDRSVMRLDKKGVVAGLSPDHGSARASFSPDCGYMLLEYSNTVTPPAYSLCRADGKEVRMLQDNAAYAASMASRSIPREFFTFTTPEGIELNGYMVKPRDFSSSKRYPVIMSQYSGPGSQSVLDKWSLDWEDYYASKGFIVVCVDGRGTGGRGTSFRTAVYRQLGRYETIDQTAAARYVASQSYVDPVSYKQLTLPTTSRV
ncbi:MAG: DPP IV N-terminal domain-containing protein, partial [Muribaculaceae bacterium]|nr:DPP IV N-terminal domain-containing protein [Muribaculaceae bacterium]